MNWLEEQIKSTLDEVASWPAYLRGEEQMPEYLYEILVPTVRNDGRPIRTRCHREWDNRVRRITGGLTVLTPAKGQWVSPDGKLFAERMIPVRIMATAEQIEQIADMTAAYYEQQAVMFYRLSDEVRIKQYPEPIA